MYAILRTIRALFGGFFVWQLIGLLPVLTWLQAPGSVTPNMWAVVAAKLALAAIGAAIFFGLRLAINKIHMKQQGVPHPALATRRMAL